MTTRIAGLLKRLRLIAATKYPRASFEECLTELREEFRRSPGDFDQGIIYAVNSLKRQVADKRAKRRYAPRRSRMRPNDRSDGHHSSAWTGEDRKDRPPEGMGKDDIDWDSYNWD